MKTALAIAMLGILLLSACGQAGPLTLPDSGKAQKQQEQKKEAKPETQPSGY